MSNKLLRFYSQLGWFKGKLCLAKMLVKNFIEVLGHDLFRLDCKSWNNITTMMNTRAKPRSQS